ncbi:MAG: sugar ABC transporter ATP-binding protein [Sphaerochaetaceae bacterium]
MKERSENTLLSVRSITKAFGLNKVLKGIDLDLDKGDVLALIGGNGAGKSTLMKIIMGIYHQDEGDIYISGDLINMSKPSVALSHAIYLVPQEPMLFPNMSVKENVMMGFKENPQKLEKRLVALMKQLNWQIDISRKADSLSIAEQQLVEILRGLLRNARILILDEPTSSLTFNEVKSLFSIIEEFKKKGIGIIYITHRLNEVFTIANRVAIMRDGIITLEGPVQQFDYDMLVKGLLPDEVTQKSFIKEHEKHIEYDTLQPVLQVKDLCGNGFHDVSFEIYPGEILGLAGVVGAGRTELATTIFGRDTISHGTVSLHGKDITGCSTRKVMDQGLNYVPEDRFMHGIFSILDVGSNTTSSKLRNMSKVFLKKRKERDIALHYIDLFSTKVTGTDQRMGSLSGGNQQKVVIARALATEPTVLILDEPTRGIDAGARGDVYAIIQQLKSLGLAILLISSDFEEVSELSDRALSMHLGRINREFAKGEITQDNLMAAAFGVTNGRAMNA